MRIKTLLPLAGLGLLAVTVSACSPMAKALGVSKASPDEFRVVAQAPLTTPPDYSLRPPSPGEPRPQELQPESQARLALLGANAAVARSEGETLLVGRAGVDKADPLIRYVIDDEFGAVSHKDKSFADKLMFWRGGKDAAPTSPGLTKEEATSVDPVDAAAEEAKVKALTGGNTVIISRSRSPLSKLPGL
jgi:hypothetical protein